MSDKKNDSFGDKMKEFESRYSKLILDEELPICVRIDGKAFHTYTKEMNRPYDVDLSSVMIKTMNYLVEETGARIGYTQSDEISLIYFKTAPHQQTFFGSRIQKLTSVLASMATAKFNQEILLCFPHKKDDLAIFDCRVWNVPTLRDAADVLVWRQKDAIKNAVSMAASSYFSDKELHKKTSSEKIAMLENVNVPWKDFPEFFKSGTYSMRKYEKREIENSDKFFKNNENTDFCLRSFTYNFHLPVLTDIQNYTDLIFGPIFKQHKLKISEKNKKKTMNIIPNE